MCGYHQDISFVEKQLTEQQVDLATHQCGCISSSGCSGAMRGKFSMLQGPSRYVHPAETRDLGFIPKS
jgi:hypothetical protein